MKMMKAIKFRTQEVQATLEGLKTATRIPIKCDLYDSTEETAGDFQLCDSLNQFFFKDENHFKSWALRKSRYKKGDILYVRETWSFLSAIECGSICLNECKDTYKQEYGCYVYRTNYGKTEDDSFPPSLFKWKPSIHMPKEAARIFLKVTDVRAERLQDITNDGAIKEGFKGVECSCKGMAYACTDCYNTGWQEPPMVGFMYTWDAIYKNWSENPWVWVIEFEKIDKPESDGE